LGRVFNLPFIAAPHEQGVTSIIRALFIHRMILGLSAVLMHADGLLGA
jgi:hypothetical protein